MYYVWWEPPELFNEPDFPEGAWFVAEPHADGSIPIRGDWLAAGPNSVSPDWIARQCGCPSSAITREEDLEVGLHVRRPDRAMDHDRGEHWITCRCYTVAAPIS